MRCKKHQFDLSSGVGVCASCLRERLFSLVAAQAQAQSQSQSQAQAQQDDRRRQEPPPLLFPRSVSPYVTRRKSEEDTASWSHNIRFYSTPQVGPTYSTSTTGGNFPSKKKNRKLSIFSNLFRSRSDKYDLDLKNSDPGIPSRNTCESSSSSWFFSTVFPSRRKKQSTYSYSEELAIGGHRDCQVMHRGMSPVRGADYEEDCDGSTLGSGESEELRKTPMTGPPVIRRPRNGHNRNVSGLAFCLSPLVRASPNRQWNQKGGVATDMAFSGEIRGHVKPHLSTAASFCANRSRKLADFGRVNHNR